jgi:hypothetical protein
MVVIAKMVTAYVLQDGAALIAAKNSQKLCLIRAKSDLLLLTIRLYMMRITIIRNMFFMAAQLQFKIHLMSHARIYQAANVYQFLIFAAIPLANLLFSNIVTTNAIRFGICMIA